MKRIIFIIITALTLVGITYSQELEDKGTAFHFLWISAPTDSGTTVSSPVFPAYPLIDLYRVVVLDSGSASNLGTVFTGGDTYEVSYLEKRPYAIVQVKGTGTVDSLSSLYLQGKNPDGSWTTIDTLSTAKEVSIMTFLSMNGLPRFTELRYTGTVADLIVSAYSVRIYVEMVIPKIYASEGKR